MDELKHCPYCGYKTPKIMMRKGRKFVNGLNHPVEQHKWYVQCPKCKARGPISSGKVNLMRNLYHDVPRPEWEKEDNTIKDIAICMWNYRVLPW